MSVGAEQITARPEIVEYIEQNPETRGSEVKQDAEFLAFWEHVEYLSDNSVRPVVSRGIGEVSVVGFFSDPSVLSNPLNDAALKLVPKAEWERRGSHMDDVKRYNTDYLKHIAGVLTRNDDEVDAARSGEISNFLVGRQLHLGRYVDGAAFRLKTGSNRESLGRNYYRGDRPPAYIFNLRHQFADMADDISEGSVMPIPEMAERIKSEGYKDFLDYLVHNFAIVRERVGERFDELYGEAAQTD
ncbi:hypothetical protein KC950_00205 [Candidatus Saccharibacteria bacterium]|nr:hypothetical protein [Candidatus Saccharibacteria bacterium]